MQTKRCSACGEIKPSSEYYRNRSCVSGIACACKPCCKEQQRRWRVKNPDYKPKRNQTPEQLRAYARDYYARNRERLIEREKAFQARNAERIRERFAGYRTTLQHSAHRALGAAVDKGLVSKPDKCERCGKAVPSAQLHGHHSDYSRPLDVTWLCTVCHGQTRRIPDAASATDQQQEAA
jgi:hypothetical protein